MSNQTIGQLNNKLSFGCQLAFAFTFYSHYWSWSTPYQDPALLRGRLSKWLSIICLPIKFLYPIIIKLGFSGILHSTMVELFYKTFKCGRVDLLSRQRKHFFVNKNECPLTYASNFLLWPVWQNAKCFCVFNTHSSLLKQLCYHILYTTNTCTAELELLTSQAFLLVCVFVCVGPAD